MPSSRRAWLFLLAIHLSAAVVLVATVATYLHRPPRGDEADFAWIARDGVAVHGAPWVDADAATKRMPRGHETPRYYGLWHPPLYFHALGVAAVVAPGSIAALRAVGLVWLALSFAVMWRMSTAALGRDAPVAVRALPLSVAALTPLVSQGSLFLDIDNTVLATLLLAFVWQFATPGDRLAPRRLVWLSALSLAVACAKLTDLPMLWLACGLYVCFEPKPGRQLAAVAVMAAVTLVSFAALYLAYCQVTGIPPEFMFTIGFGGRTDLYGTAKPLLATVRALRWHVLWFSPVLTGLLLAVALERVRVWWRTRQMTPLDLPLILSCGLFVAYALVGAMFGKYTMPAALLASVVIGVRIGRHWQEWAAPAPGLVAVALGGLLALLAALPVPIERIRAFTSLDRAWQDPRVLPVAILVGAALAIVLWWIRVTGPGRDRLAAAGLAALVVVAAVSPLDAARVLASPSDNGPLRAGPEQGMADMARWLAANVPAGRSIIGPKDLCYASGQPYYSAEEWLAFTPGDPLPPSVWAIIDSAVYPIWSAARLDAAGVERVVTVGSYRAIILRSQAAGAPR